MKHQLRRVSIILVFVIAGTVMAWWAFRLPRIEAAMSEAEIVEKYGEPDAIIVNTEELREMNPELPAVVDRVFLYENFTGTSAVLVYIEHGRVVRVVGHDT